jgi:hypothetical protein
MKNRLFIGLTLTASLLMFACQQSNNALNSNTTANINKATNDTANNTTNSVTNTNTATNTNKASQNSETSKKDEKSEVKADCEVKKDNANLYVTATDKDIKLKKGTPISWTIPDMHQGIIVVKAKVGNEWIQGEIKLDDTSCN